MCRNITRIDELNTSHWTGIKFILEEEEYAEIVMDNTSQCCEEWGYTVLNPEIIPTLIGRYIIGIYTIKPEPEDEHEPCNYYSIHFGNDGPEDDIKELKVKFYNYHNGYYEHTILIYNSLDPSDCKIDSI